MVDYGYVILQKYNFPIKEYPELADFLAQYPSDLGMMVDYSRDNSYFLFHYGLPVIKDLINERTWPYFVRMVKASGSGSYALFQKSIPAFMSLINEKTWPMVFDGFVRMSEASGEKSIYLFKSALPVFKDFVSEKTWPMFVDGFIRMAKTSSEDLYFLFSNCIPSFSDLMNKKNWILYFDGLVRMSEAAGNNPHALFHHGSGILAVKDLINERTWPDFVRMAETAGENSYCLFQFGILVVRDFINEKTWPVLIKKLLKILNYCKGQENETFHRLQYLKPLFDRFGIEIFDLLIFPTLKSQTVASFLCFKNYEKIIQSIQTKEDIKVILQILKRRGFKANDFLENVLVLGIKEGFISSISDEKVDIIYFLKHSPADYLDIYKKYKLLKGDRRAIKSLFKDLKGIKKDIFNGVLKKEYDEKILLAVLYSVFSPELTVSRNSYKKVYFERNDRQVDIPQELNRILLKEIKISKGGYKLKENEKINTGAWNDLIEVVKEVNALEIKEVDNETLGLELLQGLASGDLGIRKRYYLKKLYLFLSIQGEGLPNFNTEHSTLMKYKEFVGDRLKNDLIFNALKNSHEKKRQEFTDLIARIEKPRKFTGLAKKLYKLWMSNFPEKEHRIKKMLSENGIIIDRIDWHVSSWEDIKLWLEHHSSGTMSKQTISNIFAMLIGEDYNQMYQEMKKFEHTHHTKGRGGIKYNFMLSKKKLHSVAMLNMGVCVARDDRLWNMPDFWQMIIWDKKMNACGGVIFRNVNNYLVLSIQPNSKILNEVSPVHLYDTIIDYSQTMVKLLKLKGVLIPVDAAIHSNRGSIQAIITGKDYTKKRLVPPKKWRISFKFSYQPAYSYSEFFIVP